MVCGEPEERDVQCNAQDLFVVVVRIVAMQSTFWIVVGEGEMPIFAASDTEPEDPVVVNTSPAD